MTVSLVQDKANEIKDLGSKLIIKHEIQIRELAQLIGKMVAASPAVQHAPLRYRNLEIFKDNMLRHNRGDFDKKILLTVESIKDISWWCDNICTSSKAILIPTVDIILETDSSQKGWGGCEIKSGKKTGGNWSYEEKLNHINYLELKAVFLSIKTFCSTLENTHIQVRLDNMVAMHYINNMGGRIPELNLLARDIWFWCIARNIWISASHIPGIDNVEADRLSRTINDDLEWKLNETVFHKICQIFNLKDGMDLFASRLNHQLERYVSFLPDPEAICVDAFSFPWKNDSFYIFPPFSMLGKVLQKIQQDKTNAVVIAPLWPTQAWFPALLKMVYQQPYLLNNKNLLTMPTDPNRQHRIPKLKMGCFPLSGNFSKTEEYQKTLPWSSSTPGRNLLKDNTGVISNDGCDFVILGKLIHLIPL
ncbi:uncharacterized protein LOC133185029 [Saccostrea echinata]|uniref:uncharacterized protein LOC133185029 n=1 Tax=Saccostrea echinata TaxID=191078 RepID=UPI002A80B8EE|nr:uncharacterized protein LOC133185029 [Saccostrea echinata]